MNKIICLTYFFSIAFLVSTCKDKPEVIIDSSQLWYLSKSELTEENYIGNKKYSLPILKYDVLFDINWRLTNSLSFEPSEIIISNLRINHFSLFEIQSTTISEELLVNEHLVDAKLFLHRQLDNGAIEDIVLAKFLEVDNDRSDYPLLIFETEVVDLTSLLAVEEFSYTVEIEFVEELIPLEIECTPRIDFTYDYVIRE